MEPIIKRIVDGNAIVEHSSNKNPRLKSTNSKTEITNIIILKKTIITKLQKEKNHRLTPIFSNHLSTCHINL